MSSAPLTLSQLRPGQSARVIGLDGGAPAYRQRLLAFGLTPGTSFTLTRVAPLGDPLEVRLRGYTLTLRRDEAAILRIEALA
ncbi:FeoA family protein [Novispirillum itersonii]|uniref:FeoA family protein n=1 Tax=Novispirillum itersonii TaxID=189 RepID=UPI00035E6053|nr:FeoA family protein [Novispirillum itersonii]